MNSEIVEHVYFEIEVQILRYPADDGTWMYDWSASNGDSPDEWFETAEEAIADARSRY